MALLCAGTFVFPGKYDELSFGCFVKNYGKLFCHLLPILSPILPSAYISTGKLGLRRRRRRRRRRRNWVPKKVWVSITPFPFHPPRINFPDLAPPCIFPAISLSFHRLPDAFKNAKKRFRIPCFLGGNQELGNQAGGSLPDDSWVKNLEPFFF